MNHQSTEQVIAIENPSRQEHEIKLDGIIELPTDENTEQFFAGLFDAVIEYVEKYNGLAGLSFSHQEYNTDNDPEASDGGQTAQDR